MKKVLFFVAAVCVLAPISSASYLLDGKNLENFVRTGDPNRDLEVFALQNNISKSEAKKILIAKFGEPQKPDFDALNNCMEACMKLDEKDSD